MGAGLFQMVVGLPLGLDPRPSKVVVRGKAPARTSSTQLRYIYAPPLSAQDKAEESRLPDPPYPGAPTYMRSVYFYWWAFLREHEGYLDCCARGGSGPYAALYRDFGDVRADDFWAWWSQRGYRLFHERDPLVEVATAPVISSDAAKEVLFRVPLGLDVETALDQIRTELAQRLAGTRVRSRVSTALYPVTSTPNLPALHKVLRVLQEKRQHPGAKNYELFDRGQLVGFEGEDSDDAGVKALKSTEVSRILRRAATLLHNVGRGVFPFETAASKGAERARAQTHNQ